ncbi:restriction endonuclease subunit S [Bifidobacterium pseudolongum]|uniref:restriction endonuclease subunit S n=1 Tax=Bifidobacterium pseudolongum TaxID=1694 RepID=UPI00101F0D3E|nr:restriction endonuclease subunit S [Bifidobacterium pseudolongum]
MVEQDRCHDINAWEQRKGAEVICVRRDTIANPPKDIVDVELENLIEGGGLQGDLSLRTASTSVFHEHDTLFGRLRPYLRKFWFANTSGVKSGEIWSLYSSTLKPEFLYALTQSAQFLNQALQTAGTKMPRAEWKTIVEAYFAVPQAEEQEKIGILFQKLEQLIDAEKRKLDLLQKKKTALLRQIFGQKLRFKGYDNPWEPRRLGEIVTVVGGGTPDTNNPLYWNGDINWFTPAEIGSNAYASKSERRITEEGLEHSSAKLLPAGRTVLFTSRASIGLTAILMVEACTNQGFQSLVVSDRTDVFFLFGLCNRIKKQAIRNAAGSTFIEISGKQLAKIPLQIPSLDEQRRIGKVVRTMDSLIAVATRKIDLLTLKKKALLHQMFV